MGLSPYSFVPDSGKTIVKTRSLQFLYMLITNPFKILINNCAFLYQTKNTNMHAIILLTNSKVFEANSSTGYIVGAVIALLILGYLVYSLLKPEKF